MQLDMEVNEMWSILKAIMWALGGYIFAANMSDSIAFSFEGMLLTLAGAVLTGMFFTVVYYIADYCEKN